MEILWSWLIELLNNASFIGSLIGALLSGLVAIFVLVKGIKHQSNLLEKTKLENFLREAIFLNNSLRGLINTMRHYVELQYQEESISTDRIDEEGFPIEEISDIKFNKEIIQKDIENNLIGIRSVDRKAFTYDSFETYIKIINNCESEIEYYWDRSMKSAVGGVADILKISNNDLATLRNDLDKFINKAKKKYEKLT